MIDTDASSQKQAWRTSYLAARRCRLVKIRSGTPKKRLTITPDEFRKLGLNPSEDLLATYSPLSSEVDVASFGQAWTNAGGMVLVPTDESLTVGRFAPPQWRTLFDLPGGPATTPRMHSGEDATHLGSANEEPKIGDARLVLIPGLAFGEGGERLGRGAGWYDRALQEVSNEALVLGVCFDEEVVGADLIPMEPHDVKVSGVLTPSSLRLF